MPNGYMSAQVGEFNLDSKVVATFSNNVPAGAHERVGSKTNSDVQNRRRSVLDDIIPSLFHSEVAPASDNELMQPENGQSFF
jgi:hypothetical protein